MSSSTSTTPSANKAASTTPKTTTSEKANDTKIFDGKKFFLTSDPLIKIYNLAKQSVSFSNLTDVLPRYGGVVVSTLAEADCVVVSPLKVSLLCVCVYVCVEGGGG